jgi:hypothetical protein
MQVLFAFKEESAKAMSDESTEDLSSNNRFLLSIVSKTTVIVSPTLH